MAAENTSIIVAPVTSQHWDLLSALFATSPGINACWCMWPLRSPMTSGPDESKNQAAMKTLLNSGESPGLIGLADDHAVGWCALGPRNRYPQYQATTDRSVSWAIPCIYVEPKSDYELVARTLIVAAVKLATTSDATVLEGPPPWWLPGDAAAIARATDTFLESGFTQIGPGARMPEFRRLLGRG